MTYRKFLKAITSDSEYLSASEIAYARYHGRRLFTTFKTCIKYLKKGDKVLSVGAGIASVEKMLVLWGAEVTVVDFDLVIATYDKYYRGLGIKSYSGNLLTDHLDLPKGYYNLLLFSEVVEHIPMDPSIQIQNLQPHLASKGITIVTTPNLGSILHIGRLLFMRPIMEAPEKTFGKVDAENQATHRREYLPSEIRRSYLNAGIRPVYTKYLFYTDKISLSLIFSFLFGAVIPRFRPGMLLVGEKKNPI
jgi:2-polyprenyl-3-methyl-5-hydroxy-6-metoxy-1,4-benzoquinol methylase